MPTKIFLEFCPEIFCSFLGASWKLFGLPGDLVSNIINKEGYWKPKKLPGSPQKATKNFRAEIQKYFRWYFGWNWFFIRTFWNQLTFILKKKSFIPKKIWAKPSLLIGQDSSSAIQQMAQLHTNFPGRFCH